MIPLEQLIVYLPYRLEGVLTCNHEDDFYNQDWADLSKFQQGCIWQLAGYTDHDLNVPLGEGEYIGFLWRNEFTYVCFHSGIKPLLRQLSQLTEEIEIDGERFVPIKRLNELNIDPNFDPVVLNDGTINYDPLKEYQLLFKWHFDIFNLIGQGLAEPIK